MTKLSISTYCHLVNHRVYKDGKLIFEKPEALGLSDFVKSVYRQFKPKYPKFFKMDDISKLGFMAAELLLMDGVHKGFESEEVGIVLENSHATLVTDSSFQESVEDYDNFFPSPSVFVYTLPNIMIGEISIRNKFQGENAFFIFEDFNTEFLSSYIQQLFDTDKINACIGGWINQSATDYEAFIYWVNAEEKNGYKHGPEEILQLRADNKR